MNIILRLGSYLSSKRPTMHPLNQEDLKKRLTPLQYQVTQLNGTEPPYKNEYYKTKEEGTYECVVCFRPLFNSQLKYDSGCGWPAFFAELPEAQIHQKEDYTHGMKRTEVRCSQCDSHLGHKFEDGPVDKGGIRYCINSASLNFSKKK